MKAPKMETLAAGRPTATVVLVTRSPWGYRVLLSCDHMIDTRQTKRGKPYTHGDALACPRPGCTTFRGDA